MAVAANKRSVMTLFSGPTDILAIKYVSYWRRKVSASRSSRSKWITCRKI